MNRPEKFQPREVRYLLLTAHYRETFNFTLEGLAGAKTALARIKECLVKLREIAKYLEVAASPDPAILNKFSNALHDDLNISKAWAVVFEWIRDLNRNISQGKLDRQQAINAWLTWEKLDEVLGLNFDVKIPARLIDDTAYAQGIGLSVGLATHTDGEEKVPAEIQKLAADRMQAKNAKNFQYADAVRQIIKSKGWVIEDTPRGIKLKKL